MLFTAYANTVLYCYLNNRFRVTGGILISFVYCLRIRLDCLQKDVISYIDAYYRFFCHKISQMTLSGVYIVSLTFSLCWENILFHTKLGGF